MPYWILQFPLNELGGVFALSNLLGSLCMVFNSVTLLFWDLCLVNSRIVLCLQFEMPA